jgi:hypothetical protein
MLAMRTRLLIILLFAASSTAHGDIGETVNIGGRECLPFGGVEYDSVVGPSAAVCLCIMMEHPHREVCSHDFWILQIEAGRGGGKLQFGAGLWYMVGGMAKASLMRTWGDPMEVEPDQTYVGVELELNVFQLHGDVGLYQRIVGDRETLVTWGVGIGF